MVQLCSPYPESCIRLNIASLQSLAWISLDRLFVRECRPDSWWTLMFLAIDSCMVDSCSQYRKCWMADNPETFQLIPLNWKNLWIKIMQIRFCSIYFRVLFINYHIKVDNIELSFEILSNGGLNNVDNLVWWRCHHARRSTVTPHKPKSAIHVSNKLSTLFLQSVQCAFHLTQPHPFTVMPWTIIIVPPWSI